MPQNVFFFIQNTHKQKLMHLTLIHLTKCHNITNYRELDAPTSNIKKKKIKSCEKSNIATYRKIPIPKNHQY